MSRVSVLICAAAMVFAAPASAQLMGATELRVAVPIKGGPSTKPVADIYYLAGEVGAKETYKLSIKGAASLTLFGPDGSEILTAAGTGAVTLEAVLPFTDAYTVAVSRKTPSQPYSLTRKTTVPTFEEAYLAKDTGYQSSSGKYSKCWIIPAAKARNNIGTITEEITLAADRKSLAFFSKSSKGQAAGDFSVAYDGNAVHRISRFHDGRAKEHDFDFDPTFDTKDWSGYVGYRCKD